MAVFGSGILTLIASSPARAFSFLVTSSGQVGEIDPTTGIFTEIAVGPALSDIALSNDGDLFGVRDGTAYKIDLNSGAFSEIGNYGSVRIGGLGFSTSNALYGGGSGFNQFDSSTAAGLAGLTSLTSGSPEGAGAGDVVFDPVNNRFLATTAFGSDLFSIDLAGNTTRIGDTGFEKLWGLFFYEETLFGYTDDGEQIVIDLETGKGTFDKYVTGHQGLIFGAASLPSTGPKKSPPATSVPEPSAVFSLLGFCAFGAASSLQRSKQQYKVVDFSGD